MTLHKIYQRNFRAALKETKVHRKTKIKCHHRKKSLIASKFSGLPVFSMAQTARLSLFLTNFAPRRNTSEPWHSMARALLPSTAATSHLPQWAATHSLPLLPRSPCRQRLPYNYLADDYWSKYIDEESGIRQTISGNSDEPTEIFCLDGRCQAAPFKGVHILRHSNGKTMKMIRGVFYKLA